MRSTGGMTPHHHADSAGPRLGRRSLLAAVGGGLLMVAAAPGTANARRTGTASPMAGAARASAITQGTRLVHADLHNHTILSDGDGDPALAFGSMRSAGLDVAAITDHTTLFAIEGLSRREWDRVGVLADAADDPGNYTAIRGFEWSHPLLGHVNVWFTPDFTEQDSTLAQWTAFRNKLPNTECPAKLSNVGFGTARLHPRALHSVLPVALHFGQSTLL